MIMIKPEISAHPKSRRAEKDHACINESKLPKVYLLQHSNDIKEPEMTE
ncbi:hypothetical protein AVEN_24139-1, partial [Araneus ventricosus]